MIEWWRMISRKLVSTWVILIGLSGTAEAAGLSEIISYCEQGAATGRVPAALAKILKPDPNNEFTRRVTVGTRQKPIFVSVIERRDQGTLTCTLEGALHLGGTRWKGDYDWATARQVVENALQRAVPPSAKELTATPGALDLHLYQKSYVDCASNRFWNAGPHYKSDGGFLFPVTIDWRLDGAVVGYQVGRGLFPVTRQKHCN